MWNVWYNDKEIVEYKITNTITHCKNMCIYGKIDLGNEINHIFPYNFPFTIKVWRKKLPLL